VSFVLPKRRDVRDGSSTARLLSALLGVLGCAIGAAQSPLELNTVPGSVVYHPTTPGVSISDPFSVRVRANSPAWNASIVARPMIGPNGRVLPSSGISINWQPANVPGVSTLPAGTYNIAEPVVLAEGFGQPNFVEIGHATLVWNYDRLEPVGAFISAVAFAGTYATSSRVGIDLGRMSTGGEIPPYLSICVDQQGMQFVAQQPGEYDANRALRVLVETNQPNTNIRVILSQLLQPNGPALPASQTLVAWGSTEAAARQAAHNAPFGQNQVLLTRPLGASEFWIFSRVRSTIEDRPGTYQGLVRAEVNGG
jgi:hypothetical protein